MDRAEFILTWQRLQKEIHEGAIEHGFWSGDNDNFGQKIALVHSELSEALEYARKDFDARDNTLYSHQGIAIVFADVFIRLLDMAERYHIDMVSAVLDKHAYNQTRPYRHGKRF